MTIGASPPDGSSRISSRGIADHALRDREDLLLSAAQSRRLLMPPLRHLGEQRVDPLELASGRRRLAA